MIRAGRPVVTHPFAFDRPVPHLPILIYHPSDVDHIGRYRQVCDTCSVLPDGPLVPVVNCGQAQAHVEDPWFA